MEIRFLTPIYHPNVNSQGNIAPQLFAEDWSDQLTLSHALLAIETLMESPVLEYTVEEEIAREYSSKPLAFAAKAKTLAFEYARPRGN